MRRIADRGRTIITTVHQPASEVFLQFDNLLLLQRGGWQVYMGPIGRHQHGRDLVRYMESIPGTQRCPKGMNAASWMLDVLAGTDSSGIHRKASQVGGRSRTGSTALPGSAPGTSRSRAGSAVHPEAFSAVPKSLAGTASIPEGGIVPGRAGPNDVSPGEVDYQAIFFASSVWAKEKQTLDAACTPQPGTSPLKVDSVYARGFIPQTSILIKRGAVSYWRNESYNWVRVMTLIGLNILFGVIVRYCRLIEATSVLFRFPLPFFHPSLPLSSTPFRSCSTTTSTPRTAPLPASSPWFQSSSCRQPSSVFST
jgi:hypothetical protein